MMRFIVLAAAALAGCGGAPVPVDPDQIAKPLPRLMVTPEPQIAVPPAACEADPACRATAYYAPHRNQCSGYRDSLTGLQLYVSSLHGIAPGDWPASVTPATDKGQ